MAIVRRTNESPAPRARLWGLACVVAASSLGCTLEKLEVVSTLPCPAGSTRPDCVAPGPDEIVDGGDAEAQPVPSGMGENREAQGGGGSLNFDPGDGGSDRPPAPVRIPDKLDLLFMIDNSLSMRDKQNVLGLVNMRLITALASPPCVPLTEGVAPGAGAPCPEGETRAFHPITDIHVGIVTSSLGDVGANIACADGDRVDMAHLVGTLPRGLESGAAPSGFLSWTPGADVGALNQSFQLLTRAVGEQGCGWEMSLESWYRFLIDPFPYRELAKVVCPGSEGSALNCVQPATDGQSRILLDEPLLEQRQEFLRPDSLVAIVMLTDENDCSIQMGGQNWVMVAVDDARPFIRASPTCERNPNDPCCYSCLFGVPEVCNEELDPVCLQEPVNRLPPDADGINLRCFDQRRRFGVEFLYPTERYVTALRSPELCPFAPSLSPTECSDAERVLNPLYAGGERTPDDVFLAGIVGVPWQDLASTVDARGNPLEGDQLRYKSAAELGAADWARILGEPHESPPQPPNDPFMRESVSARLGISPANPINGREYDTSLLSLGPDDLQYACIFPLSQPRNCSIVDPSVGTCDCFPETFDTPLCEQTPGVSAAGTTQYWSKAYPGLRQLEVLRGYGENSIVSSICAPKVFPLQAAEPDYAYRPAFNALVERLQQRLRSP